MNIVIKPKYQRDISQYLYCKEFGVTPFPGAYGEQPQRWINKVNIIKMLWVEEKSVCINKHREKQR